MSQQEMLIGELAARLTPTRHVSLGRICAEWLVVMAVSLLVVGNISGFRPDLVEQLHNPFFLSEILTNLLLIVAAGVAATLSAYPDRGHSHYIRLWLFLVFAIYSAVMLTTALITPDFLSSAADTVTHGVECLVCILGFAAMPAIWMFWRLRQLASTQPYTTGMAALLMAVATGCLGVRLVETELVPTGLLLWHYLPLIVFSAIGFQLGKWFFRW